MPTKRTKQATTTARPRPGTGRPALKVTPAQKWRRGPAGELVTMPSGNVARLQKVSLEHIAATGSLPDSLSGLISEVIAATTAGRDINAPDWEKEWREKATQELNFAEMVRLIDRVVPLVFLEPKVVATDPDYEAGQIALEDLEYPDRQFAFVWAMEGVGLLVNFFQKPAGGVPVVRGGQGVRPAPERAAGDPG